MSNFKKKISQHLSIFLLFLFIIPASNDYKLVNFSFGGGGTTGTTSPDYAVEGILGGLSANRISGTDYKLGSGLIFSQQSNVPIAPTFENTANWYNKLHFIIDASGNASDTKYALAISTDNFASDTRFVQSDNTIGPTLGTEDYQTLDLWGDSLGEYVIGLDTDTTYYLKAKAMQADFSETEYGPTASTSTVPPSMNYDIDISATDEKTDPPFTITFDDLVAGSIIDSPQRIWVDFSTNGEAGGFVYVYGQNGGLYSDSVNFTIPSLTGNLGNQGQGMGAQSVSATQLTAQYPYNDTGDVVGIINSTIRPIYKATGPVTAGRASFIIKAKSSNITKAASDYSETLTIIAAGNF